VKGLNSARIWTNSVALFLYQISSKSSTSEIRLNGHTQPPTASCYAQRTKKELEQYTWNKRSRPCDHDLQYLVSQAENLSAWLLWKEDDTYTYTSGIKAVQFGLFFYEYLNTGIGPKVTVHGTLLRNYRTLKHSIKP
jgi:outer membrane protease